MADDKPLTVPEKEDIEIILGKTNVLLIAPHGVETPPYDDENTAELTRQIRSRLGCSAIINRAYRKPDGEKDDGRNNGDIDVENKFLNLNRIDHVKDFPDFTDKIKGVVNSDSLTYVFWIHGIDNGNIKEHASRLKYFEKGPNHLHALIGYGQGPDRSVSPKKRTKVETKDRQSIKKELAEKFAELLTERGMNTELTSRSAKNFCARSSNNMNQWFILNGYDSSRVQSLQLEIREEGFRNIFKIGATADIIAETISAFVKVVNSQVVKEDIKIEEAYIKLKGIFGKHFQNAMLEVGQYLVNKMYGSYESAIDKEPKGKESLAKLVKRIQEDSQEKGNAPSRTWVYDSVNLAIDNHLYEQKKLPSVYGQLGHSHKVNLTYAPNDTVEKVLVKKALIKEAAKKEYPVAKLRERIREEKNKLNPDHIPFEELNSEISMDDLKKFSSKRIELFKTKSNDQIEKMNKLITLYQKNLEKVEETLQNKQAD